MQFISDFAHKLEHKKMTENSIEAEGSSFASEQSICPYCESYPCILDAHKAELSEFIHCRLCVHVGNTCPLETHSLQSFSKCTFLKMRWIMWCK